MDIDDPQYGATVYFELYQLSNQPYVKFLYSNVYSDEPKPITHLIRACPLTSDLCPLEQFIAGQKDYLTTNIEMECQQNIQEIYRRREGSLLK
uniref:RWD domain-containing protein n=1 Tax=Elaeophora elaphi TaxID=1147741 RepID=A0A0R3RND0_9BILA